MAGGANVARARSASSHAVGATWLDVGALPSDTVRSLLRKAGVLKARHEARLARKLNSSAVPVREASEQAASSDASE